MGTTSRLICDERLKELVLSAGADGQVEVPSKFLLLPLGHIESTKGNFDVTPAGMTEVVQRFKARRRDIPFDYEHQTLKDVRAPASGWIKDLVPGADGLWVDVEWTAAAKSYIANKEYRYYSPVVYVRDGVLVGVHSSALTNDPAITGIAPLVNKDMEFIQEEPMREELIAALGLDPGVSDADLLAAVKGLKDKIDAATAALALKADAKVDEVKSAIDGLKATKDVAESAVQALALKADAKGADVRGAVIALKNPAGHVSAEEFKALKDKLEDRDAEEAVQLALKDGKITPAQKDWAKRYALTDKEGFAAFTATAPAVVQSGLTAAGRTGGSAAGSKLTDEERLVCKQMGVTEEEFLKANPAD